MSITVTSGLKTIFMLTANVFRVSVKESLRTVPAT